MFGGKSSFELLVSPGFLWMSAQIIPERQPMPHLRLRLGHMHMMGAPRSKGRHAFNEEHSIFLRIIGPIDVIKISKGFNKGGLRVCQ